MKKIYLVLTVSVLVLLILIFVNLFQSVQQKNTAPGPTQRPTTIEEIKKNYNSHLSQTLPGKSTISDVTKTNGSPSSVKKIGNKTFFYYDTPVEVFKNIVGFENGIEYYALENIFDDSAGNYKSFVAAYGEPDLTMYDNSPYVWRIFLNSGIGVQTNNKDVAQILYFIPQKDDIFVNGVAKNVGLSLQPPSPEALHP